MVSNLEAEIQWTFAWVLSGLTILAVSYGGGIRRKEYVWFFGLKRWFFPPVILISIIITAVFTLSGIGVFLWFRMRQDFDTSYYDAVLALHSVVLGMLFLFGKLFFEWHYLLFPMIIALVAFGAALVALILMGVQGNQASEWAPFGFYFVLPVFLAYFFCQAFYIWLKNPHPLRSCMKKMDGDDDIERGSVSSSYHYGQHHSSTRHVSSAVISKTTDVEF